MCKLLKLSSLSLAAIVMGLSAADVSAAPIVIDGFTSASSSYPLIDASVGGVVSSGNDANLRVVTLSTTAKNAGLDFASAGVFPTDLGGIFDFNSTAGAAATATISYGSAGSASGLADTAYIIPDDYSFYLDLLAWDLPSGAPLSTQLTLYSGATSASQTVLTTTAGAQSISFDGNLFPSGIRSNVTGISLTFVAPAAADFRIGSFVADTTTIVPEPAALAITSPLALAMLARRRRA